MELCSPCVSTKTAVKKIFLHGTFALWFTPERFFFFFKKIKIGNIVRVYVCVGGVGGGLGGWWEQKI